MQFKISYVFPVIIIGLALYSIFYLAEIEPFNYIVSAVVFVIAGAMVWRIYYDVSSSQEKQEAEYEPSAKVTDLIKEGPKESKMKLDDFLRSSPKEFQSKDFEKEFDLENITEQPVKNKEWLDPFSDESIHNERYQDMKKKTLKELRDVIKPKKKPDA